MTRKFSISVSLMVAAIILIAAFQVYWIVIKINEEKRTLRFRTNVIFRESVFDLQSSKLKLDSTTRLRYGLPPDIARFTDMVRKRLSDSSAAMPSQPTRNSIITVERPAGVPADDSLLRRSYKAGGRFFEFLIGIDSLQDSLRVTDIREAYTNNLQKENINVPFSIIRTEEADIKRTNSQRPEWNKATIGFTHPISYQVQLGNTFNYIFGKVLPQVVFSVFLIGLTITAFSVLYRNLRAQRRLTDIKNDFISNITHELKTPISTVSVAIEAIKNFNVIQQPERTKEYLDIAGNELSRLSMLVDKVLKLSMFEQQQTELKYERFDVKQLATEVIASMGLQFEKAKAKVELHSSGQQFMITADHMHITSVLYNLLDNALKYSREKPEIEVSISSKDNNWMEIRVSDNGIGIPAAYKTKIFEKFFRVPTDNKHNIKGYGLGLSYVAHIVNQHHGTITLHSEPGKGSEFIIKLPLTHEEN
ncbi:HAMP domain-containing sensor histidine kinase [Agriterribacter sp.]|uniref:sensor histidine kinase n=1 Tax=Agriterribacter sp. TaxID=2821509 RepID=UPI002C323A89|nr:HAMP domain-containing sensor histidine kinase [Agriterribacter sp.]HRO48045.1 HAMP domain-containing sensor histidine kinase [Agriterribacter sp.]HRQ18132.1 HAMP domain-containing sensor histidine kinase [Agriterribacter sp.]